MAIKRTRSDTDEKHNYPAEKKYAARPAQKKARARRNKARAAAVKAGTVKKGDGKEVDHSKTMARGKTKVISRKANRVKANKSPAR